MTPLDRLPALEAEPVADHELSRVRYHRRQLGLILLRLVHGVDSPIAALPVTHERAGNLDPLVDLPGNRPLPPPSVALAGLAPGSLGIGLGIPLRERTRLALPGTPCFLEQLLELRDPRVPLLQLVPQIGQLALELPKPFGQSANRVGLSPGPEHAS